MSWQSMKKTVNQHTRGLSLKMVRSLVISQELTDKPRVVLEKKGDLPLKNQ